MESLVHGVAILRWFDLVVSVFARALGAPRPVLISGLLLPCAGSFLGVAIVADLFMGAIEVITSKEVSFPHHSHEILTSFFVGNARDKDA